MANELPIAILVGIPGPAGSGVTGPDWTNQVGRVNALYTPTADPLTGGAARSSNYVTNSLSPQVFGESIITFNVDTSKSTIITAWASADITTPSGNVANFGVTIGTGTYVGTYYQTPTAAGTYPAIASIGLTAGAGVLGASFTVRPIVFSSTAVNITFANVRVWAQCIQPG